MGRLDTARERQKIEMMFSLYQKAINEIDDFFEYRYTGYDRGRIKAQVMSIIDKLTEKLKKI